MYLDQLRPRFKTICQNVGLAYHEDAFAVDNIPSSILNKAFCLEIGQINLVQTDQNILTLSCPVTVRFYLSGYRDPISAIDQSMVIAENLVIESQSCVNRFAAPLKNIVLGSILPQAIAEDNDNAVLTTVEFTALIILGI